MMGPSTSNARKPLKEKVNTVGTGRSAPIKRVGGEWVVDGAEDLGTKKRKGKGKAISQHITSSNSSTEDSDISRALLNKNQIASKWKGQLSRNPSTSSSTSISSTSNARRILETKNRRQGPTIDFDGPELPYDDEEMYGETQRRRKRKEDRGGWGKLDLMNPEEEEQEDSGSERAKEGSRKRVKLEELELSSSQGVEGGRDERVIEQDFEEPPRATRPSYTLPQPPPPRLTSRTSHHRSASSCSTQSSGSGSAEELQALLVPCNQKRPARILVPDSDGPTPPNLSDMEDGEEPETEAETEEEMMVPSKKGGNAQDDSGFVEASNIIELLDSSSPPRQPELELEEEEDDNVSIPDSQPSVASHLSLLGSSSPMRFIGTSTLPPTRPLRPLQPTESGILMPPPPALPRKRLRRGPPPRPSPPSSPPHSSRILVEDTQTQNQHPYPYNPYAHAFDSTGFYVEETQYPDSLSHDPLLSGMYWKLPSDLPVLDSDQIVLPSPKPLRPAKEKPLDLALPESEPMPFPFPTDLPLSPSRPISSPPPPLAQTVMRGTDWNGLDQAWKGSKPLTPPPPPAPRQSRLTDHFQLESNAKDGGEELVEDSQNLGGGDLSLMQVFGKAVRDSITGIGSKGEREDGKGKMERVQEEEEEICSSPLSSLSSLPPSPAPISNDQLGLDMEKGGIEMEVDEEEVIPDSDPEDDAPILAGRQGGIISPLGTPIRPRFPTYELPLDIIEDAGGEGREETQWESYWTLGSTAPQLTPPQAEEADDREVFETKTVAQMLLEAPDVDLPEDWYEDEGGELVSRRHIDLEEGDL